MVRSVAHPLEDGEASRDYGALCVPERVVGLASPPFVEGVDATFVKTCGDDMREESPVLKQLSCVCR